MNQNRNDFQLEGGLGGQFRNVDVGTSGSGYSVSGSSSIKSQLTQVIEGTVTGDGKLTLGRERLTIKMVFLPEEIHQ